MVPSFQSWQRFGQAETLGLACLKGQKQTLALPSCPCISKPASENCLPGPGFGIFPDFSRLLAAWCLHRSIPVPGKDGMSSQVVGASVHSRHTPLFHLASAKLCIVCGHQTVGTGMDCASRELTEQTVRGWGEASAGHSCGINKRVSIAVSKKKSWFSGPGREKILFVALTLHRSNHKGLARLCLGRIPFTLVSAQMALSVLATTW